MFTHAELVDKIEQALGNHALTQDRAYGIVDYLYGTTRSYAEFHAVVMHWAKTIAANSHLRYLIFSDDLNVVTLFDHTADQE